MCVVIICFLWSLSFAIVGDLLLHALLFMQSLYFAGSTACSLSSARVSGNDSYYIESQACKQPLCYENSLPHEFPYILVHVCTIVYSQV